MGAIANLYQGYVDFATENGTVNDNTSWLLLGGAALIAFLAVFAAYNAALAVANGVRRTGGVLARIAAMRPAAAAVPVPAATIPSPRVVSVATARESVKVG